MNDEVRRRRLEHLAALMVFIIGGLVFLAPVLGGDAFTAVGSRRADIHPWATFGGGPPQPAQADQADLSRPWQHQMSGAVREGTLALWNPDTFVGGGPLFANGSSAVIWPPRLLVSLLPEPWAHDVYSLLHLVLWGLAMYALVRELGGSAAAGIIAGVAWQLGAFNLGWLHLEVVVGVPVALPLGILVVHRAARRARWSTALGGGLLLGAVLTSGHLLWHLITLEVVGVVAAALAVRSGWAARSRGWRAALGAAAWPLVPLATAVAAAAVVLVPTAITLSGTPRTPFGEEVVPGLLGSWGTLVDLVRPPTFDTMSTTVLNTRLGFSGTLITALALIGLAGRRPGSGTARGVVIVGLAIATWEPAARVAYHLVPGFDVFYPYTRLLGWVAFGVVLAAALGVDTVIGAAGRWWAARTSPPHGARPEVAMVRRVAAVTTAVVVLVTVVELVPLGRRLNPPFPPRDGVADSFDATPLIRAAQAVPSRDGMPPVFAPITRDYEGLSPVGPPMLWANTATLHGLVTTSGYDSTLPAGAARLLRVADGTPIEETAQGLVGAFVPILQAGRTNPTALRRLGATHLVLVPEIDPRSSEVERFGVNPDPVYAGPDGTILELLDPLAALRVVPRAVVLDDDAALRRLADPEHDGAATVVLAEEPEGGVGFTGGGDGSVRMVHRGRNTQRIEATADGPSWLVLPVNRDPGWQVRVDGRPVPAVRAEVARMAVPLGGGDHVVELRYRPPGWIAGLTLTLLALAAWVAALWRDRRRRSGGSAADDEDGLAERGPEPRLEA